MRGVLCKYNQNEEKKIGHQSHIYCTKREEWVPVYKCKKGACKDHKFKTEVVVQVPVGRCDECPFHNIRVWFSLRKSGNWLLCPILRMTRTMPSSSCHRQACNQISIF